MCGVFFMSLDSTSWLSNINKDILCDHRITLKDFKKVAKIRKWGKTGYMWQQLRKQPQNNNCIPLSIIILANIQSLRSKIDELLRNVTLLQDYRDACPMAFTKTWLNDSDSDTSLDLNGFRAPNYLDQNNDLT